MKKPKNNSIFEDFNSNQEKTKNSINKTAFPIFTIIFCGSGLVHLLSPDMFIQIMPPFLPFPKVLNILAGLTELAIGISFWTRYRKSGIYSAIGLLSIFFIVIHLWHLQIGEFPGFPELGTSFLWGRLIMQLLLIYCLWTMRNTSKSN